MDYRNKMKNKTHTCTKKKSNDKPYQDKQKKNEFGNLFAYI